MRMDFGKASPQAYQAMHDMEARVQSSGLEKSLIELIKVRVSQLNGCAYCVDMHTKDARAAGETEQRLYLLSVWHESPVFTARERAALAWADALTLIAGNEVSDELYETVREAFNEKETADLTLAVIAINGWNRIGIPFQPRVGSYQPAT